MTPVTLTGAEKMWVRWRGTDVAPEASAGSYGRIGQLVTAEETHLAANTYLERPLAPVRSLSQVPPAP